MNLKRGPLPILSGMLVSFGLAILVHKMIEAKASKHSSTSASDSTALNAPSQSNGSGGANLAARGDVRIAVISDLNS